MFYSQPLVYSNKITHTYIPQMTRFAAQGISGCSRKGSDLAVPSGKKNQAVAPSHMRKTTKRLSFKNSLQTTAFFPIDWNRQPLSVTSDCT